MEVVMFFEELKLGMTRDIPPVVIKKEKMIDFALNYDNIPLHTDEEYCKNTHFKELVAPGVMTFMSVWNSYLTVNFFDDSTLVGKSTRIEWLKPVFAGDILSGKATVSRIEDRNEKNGMVEIRINVYNQDGVLVIVNHTETIVKKRLHRG